MKRTSSASTQVIHSHNVIEKLFNSSSDINLSESKLRGYMITGETDYLHDYKISSKSAIKQIQDLLILTSDNSDQTQKIEQLLKLTQSRFSLIEYFIQLRSTHDLQYIIDYVHKNKYVLQSGKNLSNQIRELSNHIIDNENNYLFTRNLSASLQFQRITFLASVGSGLSIFILVLCYIFLSRQLIYQFKVERNLHQSKKDLAVLAYYDTLTGLANRTMLIKDINNATAHIEHNKNISLLYLDIDNFKNINDSYGHPIGDKLLQEFSKRLNSLTYTEKTIYRLGGDEFAIILRNIKNIQDIKDICQQILSTTKHAIHLDNNKLYITCSIGISASPYNGMNADSLLKNADIAMYRAKKLGKNTYQFCTPELTIEFEDLAVLEQNLHHAVIKNKFVLFYQPKMCLHSDVPTGVEALIRWQGPNNELIYPANFISLAENNGLIVPIGEWMLRSVCEQGFQWQKDGLLLHNISINVSIRELMTHNFIDRVRAIISESNFNPSLLEFEVTETILMNNSVNNFSVLTELKNMGIKITIDDFGTGYSSLSYLNFFSIDKIKIDQSFVKEISSTDHNPTIINTIILMAHSLGMKVVAEGVETTKQLDFLKQRKCDEVQGYYYSHPLSAGEVHGFFKDKASEKRNIN
jgi:diguanylate cyclase (GGDEF)-like protein